MGFDIELLQFAHGQVNAPASGVFADIANDVGQLKRQPQLVRIGGGGVVNLAKNPRCHFADDAGHQMAVALQTGNIEKAVLGQVHLAALNDRLQMACLDAVNRGHRHQRFHDRVAGRSGKRFEHLGVPPGQFGGRHARVHHLINNIVDFAAKRIKSGDGSAALFRQKQKCVIKTAARGDGFLLDVLFRGHGKDCCMRKSPWGLR